MITKSIQQFSDDSDIEVIHVVNKSTDSSGQLKEEKEKDLDNTLNSSIDLTVKHDVFSTEISEDTINTENDNQEKQQTMQKFADDSDIEEVSYAADNKSTGSSNKLKEEKEKDLDNTIDMDKDHQEQFNLKNPTADDLFRVILCDSKKYEVESPLKRCRQNIVYSVECFALHVMTMAHTKM